MKLTTNPSGPPPFPGEEAMREADKRGIAWARSEEGQKLLKERLTPEQYEAFMRSIEHKYTS